MILRRLLTASLLVCATALASCVTSGPGIAALVGNRLILTPPQIQQALDHGFPKRYDGLGELTSVTLLNPRLSIPQDGQRLHLDFDLGIDARGFDASASAGHFAVSGGLRFDPATHGLHLQDPAIDSVDVPALGGALNAATRDALEAWLADYARQEPVYRLEDSQLDMIGTRDIESVGIAYGQVMVELHD